MSEVIKLGVLKSKTNGGKLSKQYVIVTYGNKGYSLSIKKYTYGFYSDEDIAQSQEYLGVNIAKKFKGKTLLHQAFSIKAESLSEIVKFLSDAIKEHSITNKQ